jgi:hypothetical protein
MCECTQRWLKLTLQREYTQQVLVHYYGGIMVTSVWTHCTVNYLEIEKSTLLDF